MSTNDLDTIQVLAPMSTSGLPRTTRSLALLASSNESQHAVGFAKLIGKLYRLKLPCQLAEALLLGAGRLAGLGERWISRWMRWTVS